MLKKKIDIYADAKQFTLASLNVFREFGSGGGLGNAGAYLDAEFGIMECFAKLMEKEYVHFELPDNGARLYDLVSDKSTSEIIHEFIAGSHLPFPNVCFEFELSKELAEKSQLRGYAILAHEDQLETDHGLVRVIMLNIISQSNLKVSPAIGAKYQAVCNSQAAFVVVDEEQLQAHPKFTHGILMPDQKTIVSGYTNKDAFTEAAEHAIQTVIAALAALSCSNVKIEKGFPPSIVDNNKRIKKKIVPYTQKHFITVASVVESHGANPNKGSSSKKATHIRRGHIRRYQNGNKIWIEATIINGGAGEAKPKSYKVK